jgi:hypothetical protein
MQRTLNMKVKYRESFRPFAPSVLREREADWFEFDGDSPYMLIVAELDKRRRRVMTDAEDSLFGIEKLNVSRSEVPATTHVDYSARIQTVRRETNPRCHALLERFERATGLATVSCESCGRIRTCVLITSTLSNLIKADRSAAVYSTGLTRFRFNTAATEPKPRVNSSISNALALPVVDAARSPRVWRSLFLK